MCRADGHSTPTIDYVRHSFNAGSNGYNTATEPGLNCSTSACDIYHASLFNDTDGTTHNCEGPDKGKTCKANNFNIRHSVHKLAYMAKVISGRHIYDA